MKKWIVICVAAVMALAMTGTAFAGSAISKDEATSIALKNANTSKSGVSGLETEYDKQKKVWEIEFVKKDNKADYEYDIAGSNGRIVEKSVDLKYKHNSSKSKVGKEAAQKAVAKHSNSRLSTVKKGTCKYEYDDMEGTYDVKFVKGSYKYDYEVLAPTGKIIEYGYKYLK